MQILAKQLLGLPVVTEAGQRLGTVRDIEFSSDSYSVSNYLVGGWWGRVSYRIAPPQVKRITAAEMVVEDTVARVPAGAAFKRAAPAPALGSALLREEEK